GVGGHCFNKNTVVFLRNSNHQKIKPIGQYIDSLKCSKKQVKDVELFYPENVKVLSYDMIKNTTSFKPVKIASKRKTNELIRINCAYNYKLEVTDLHPVIHYDDGLKVKFAKDIKKGDNLVLNKILPSHKNEFNIDLIEHLNDDLKKKIRVKLNKNSFKEYRTIIDSNIAGPKREYYRYESFPLNKYLMFEKQINVSREDIYLCTGRGPSFKKVPAVIEVDKDFLRLVGYYLSEGCITKDKSYRIRFTFNTKEKEYINDVNSILRKKGFDFSEYNDKNFDAHHIKVSSNILGVLFKDILACGTNCYDMQIPEQFFELRKDLKEELLKGLFRGDGGVSWYNGKRTYKKGLKEFNHNNNSICVNYFTSSPILFQQVVLLLLNLDIVPRLSKRKGYLSIGYLDVKKAKMWFLGEKRDKITNYIREIIKTPDYKKTKIYKTYITLNVESIDKIKTDYVYSFEVPDTNTLITSNGIIAHNCISVDPHYLIAKAKGYGCEHKCLRLAREINDSMPEYAVELLEKEVKLEGANVGVLGLAYKGNIDDVRESPAHDVIKTLKQKKANVIVYDPYILEKSDVKSLKELLEKSDYLILVTSHDEFKNMDLELLKKNNIKIIIDGRNCLDKEKIEKLGIKYKGVGR
ncbi:MAG: UDP binding domain-containing protein, partial [Nanoarchaeota archaeon]